MASGNVLKYTFSDDGTTVTITATGRLDVTDFNFVLDTIPSDYARIRIDDTQIWGIHPPLQQPATPIRRYSGLPDFVTTGRDTYDGTNELDTLSNYSSNYQIEFSTWSKRLELDTERLTGNIYQISDGVTTFTGRLYDTDTTIKQLGDNDFHIVNAIGSQKIIFTTQTSLTPSFGTATVADQSYMQGRAISDLQLPAASGGDGTLSYSVIPALPAGLSFDAASRKITGTPTAAQAATEYTYSVIDTDGDIALLKFMITVVQQPHTLKYTFSDDGTTVTIAATGRLDVTNFTFVRDGVPGDYSRIKFDDTGIWGIHPPSQPTTQARRYDGLPDFVTTGKDTYGGTSELDGLSNYAYDSNYHIRFNTWLKYLELDNGRLTGNIYQISDGVTTFTGKLYDTDTTIKQLGDNDFHIVHAIGSQKIIFTTRTSLTPSFGTATVADKSYMQNQAISELQLPAASGGDGTLTYSVIPALPTGLSFDAASRKITGTPTAAQAATEYTYSVTDTDGDIALLKFMITVVQRPHTLTFTFSDNGTTSTIAASGSLDVSGFTFDRDLEQRTTLNLKIDDTGIWVIHPQHQNIINVSKSRYKDLPAFVTTGGDTYTGSTEVQNLSNYTQHDFAIRFSPSGRYLEIDKANLTGGIYDLTGESATFTGTLLSTLKDNDFHIEHAIGIHKIIFTTPVYFGNATIGNKTYTKGKAISDFELPQARSSDDQTVSYSISPDLPAGLSFNAASRKLTGTPTAVQAATEYTYTATDSDGDTATLTFEITVLQPRTLRFTFSDDGTTTTIAAAGSLDVSGFTFDTDKQPTNDRFLSIANTDRWAIYPSTVVGINIPLRRYKDLPGFVTTGSDSYTGLDQVENLPNYSDEFTIRFHTHAKWLEVDKASLTGDIYNPSGKKVTFTGTLLSTLTDNDFHIELAIGHQKIIYTTTPNKTPDFGVATVADQTYVKDEAISELLLPAATGGDGTLSYSISPALPAGLSFDDVSRKLTGTPTTDQAGTEYTYTASDDEEDTATLTFKISVVPVPDKPSGLSAVGNNGQVSLRWVNPRNSLITKYQYRQRAGSGNFGAWEDMSDSDANTTSHTVTGLTNGTGYGFRIRAVISQVNGVESDVVTATPRLMQPAKPTRLHASVPATGSVDLHWVAVDASATSWEYRKRFEVRRGSDGTLVRQDSYENWTAVTNSTATTRTVQVTGLETGVNLGSGEEGWYRFQVRGRNSLGMGPASDEVQARPVLETGLFGPGYSEQPQRFTIISGQHTTYTYPSIINLHTTEANPSMTIRVEPVTITHTFKPQVDGWIPSHSADLHRQAHTFSGTHNGATTNPLAGTASVRAGGSQRGSVNFYFSWLVPPDAPTSLSAAAAGSGRALLSWGDLPSTTHEPIRNAISYWEYRSKESTATDYTADWKRVAGSSGATRSHLVTGLDDSKSYDFAVRAVIDAARIDNLIRPDDPTADIVLEGSAATTSESFTPGEGVAAVLVNIPSLAVTEGASVTYTVSLGKQPTADVTITPSSSVAALASVSPSSLTFTASNWATSQTVTVTGVVDDDGVGGTATVTHSLSSTDTDYAGLAALALPSVSVTVSDDDTPDLTLSVTSLTGLDEAGTQSRTYTVKPTTAPASTLTVTPLTGSSSVTLSPASLSFDSSNWQTAQTVTVTGAQDDDAVANDVLITHGLSGPAEYSSLDGTAYQVTAAVSDDDTAGITAPLPARFNLREGSSYGYSVVLQTKPSAAVTLSVGSSNTNAVTGGSVTFTPGNWATPQTLTITAVDDATATSAVLTRSLTGAAEYAALTLSSVTVDVIDNDSPGLVVFTNTLAMIEAGDDASYTISLTTQPTADVTLTVTSGDSTLAQVSSDTGSTKTFSGSADLTFTNSNWSSAQTVTVRSPVDGNSTDDSVTLSHTVASTDAGYNNVDLSASDITVSISDVPAPAAPTGLTATAGDAQVTLEWTDPGNSTITRYQVQQKSGTDAYGEWGDIEGSTAATTSHILTGLDNNTTYTFRIRAVNAGGVGAASVEAAATPIAIPAAPTGLVATAGDAQVTLDWTDPGDSSITGYQVQQKSGSDDYGEWSAIANSTATTTSHTVTGLDNDTAYTFRIRAVNAAGGGEASAAVTATPIAVPAAPTEFKAKAGDTQVTLSWADPDNSTITGYQVQQKSGDDAYGAWNDIEDSTATTTEHTVTGLTNNTVYGFRVRAVNASGEGAASQEVLETPVTIPAAPTGLTAVAGDAQVTLGWTDPGNASINNYQYQSKSGSDGYGAWTDMMDSGAATVSYKVTGLVNDTAYTFRIRAVNDTGESPESAEVTATPIALPAAPTGLTATVGDAQVTLGWTDPQNSTITDYQYQYKSGSDDYGAWTAMMGSTATTTSHLVTGLVNDTAYTFRIRAVNASGEGAASAEVTQTPIAVPLVPTGLTIAKGDAQLTLGWTDPQNSTITGYQYQYKSGSDDYSAWTAMMGSTATTTSHLVTGLVNETAYTFRIRALNASGAGAVSAEVTQTPIAVPAAPTGLTAAVGDAQVTLGWTDPQNSTITGYEYQYKSDSSTYGAWTAMTPSTATTISHLVTGLVNETAYTFRIRALNASGAGAVSAEVTQTPIAVPAAPTGLTAAVGDAQLTLGWTDPQNSTITGYEYQYKSGTGTYGAWTAMANSTATTTSHPVTGLVNETAYTFRIRALNASGAGAVSAEVTQTPIAVPAAPTGLTVAVGNTELVLSWTDPGNSTITGYQYQYKSSGNAYGAWMAMTPSTATTTTHTVTGLTNNTAYTLRIRALNASGEGAVSAEVTQTPIAVPAAPTGLTAAVGDTELVLSWTDPGNSTITGYQYQYKSGNSAYGAWMAMTDSTATTTSHTVTGLVNGTAYTIRIRALNANGESTASAEVTQTPIAVPAAPTGLTAAVGDSELVLSWTDPGNSTITGYQYQSKSGSGTYGAWLPMTGSTATTTSHTVMGLINGTAYTFRIRALNVSGDGAVSAEVTQTPIAVPAAPTGLTAAVGDAELELSWTDPGNSTITGYEYQYKSGNGVYGAWMAMTDSTATTTSHTVSGLVNGTAYTLRIRALNVSGAGAVSAEVTQTPIVVPAAPTGLMAAVGDTELVLNWTDPGNGSITGYQYQYKSGNGAYGAWMAMTDSTATTTSHTVTGLVNGTAYTIRIRALNVSGEGAASAEVTQTPIAVPAVPVGLTAAVGDAELSLSWTDPGNSTITGYEYQYKSGGGAYGAWTAMTGSTAITTSHMVTGLVNNTAYTLRIRAMNVSGAGTASAEVTQTPIAVPAAPTGLTAAVGDAQLSLSWTDPGNSTITGYQYQYKSGNNAYSAWTAMTPSTATTTSHTVTGLVNDTAYTLRIRALNVSGAGAASAEVTQTPIAVPAAPAGLTAAVGDAQLSLSWTDPGNSTISGYQYQYKSGNGAYGAWTAMMPSTATTTSFTVTSLVNGTAYTIRIRALNISGAGAASAEVTQTPIAVPAAPTGLTAAVGDAELSLSWTDPGNSTITGYEFQYKSGNGTYGAWTAMTGSTATTTSHTVTGLVNDTAYTLRIRALNVSGAGAASAEVTQTPIAVPAAPTGLTAAVGDAKLLLSWTDPGNSTISGYQYQYKSGNGAYGAWTAMTPSTATTTSHTVTGLVNDTAYTLRIRALNVSGAGAVSAEVTQTPIAVPAAPTGLMAAVGDAQLSLSWTDSGNSTISGYQYQYKSGNGAYGAWTAMTPSTATTTSHTVTGLVNDTAYTLRIRALNVSGAGAASAEVTQTPIAVPAAPTGLTAAVGDAELELSWTNPGNNTITGYQYQYKSGNGAYGAWTAMTPSTATTTSHTVMGLVNDTAYTLRIRAMNVSGAGAASAEVTQTPIAVPAAPTGLTAAVGDAKLELSWTDPRNSTITDYQYQYKSGNGAYGAWMSMTGSNSTTTSHTLRSLVNDTAYTIRIRALNISGAGAVSAEVTQTPIAVPAAPTGLTAAVGDAELLLSWTDPGNSTISGYQYQYKSGNGAYGAWTAITGSTATTTSHTVTGLVNDTAYTLRIRALNISGAGAVSAEVTQTPIAVPAAPVGLTVAVGDARLVLNWTDPGNSTITGYQYQYKSGSGTYGAWMPMTGSTATTTSHLVTGLVNDTAYAFRIRALNISGAGAVSAEVTQTPIAVPAAPTGLTATGGDEQVILTWTDPGNRSITGYEFQYKSGSGPYGAWMDIENSTASTVSHTVANLTNGVQYVFKIRAANVSGDGAESVEKSAIPQPPIPAVPTGFTVQVGDNRATLRWSIPTNTTSISRIEVRHQVKGASDWSDWVRLSATTTEYTVTGLVNGETYIFEVRAVNSTGSGEAATKEERLRLTVPDKPTGLKAELGDAVVSLSWVLPTNVNEITGVEVRHKEAATSDWSVWTMLPADATSYTVSTGLAIGVVNTFEVRAVNSVGNGSAASIDATPVLRGSLIEESTRETLPEVAAIMGSEIVSGIRTRIQGFDTTSGSGGVRFNARHNELFSSEKWNEPVQLDEQGFLFDGRFETLVNSLGQSADGRHASPVSIWTGAALKRFKDDGGALQYDGEMSSYSFGLDTRLGENTLGGFTMSRFTGKTDYEREGASGRQQINVTSVNPYFGLKKSEYSVWSFVGAGSGELEVEQDFVSGVSTSDLSLNTLGVGASGEVWRSARTTLHLTGEITVTELSVDGSDTIDAVKVGANRSRMILSASQRYQMDRGGYVEPKFEFGVAHDSGDGSTGSRLEIGAGMYYLSPSQRISMSLSSYSLVERNNYSEWGVEAGIRMLPGARERGLSFSLQPSYGATVRGVDRIWESSRTIGDEVDDEVYRPRLDANLGFGIPIIGNRGLLTPYGEASVKEDDKTYRVGTRFNNGSGFELNLYGETEDSISDTRRSIRLQGGIRF